VRLQARQEGVKSNFIGSNHAVGQLDLLKKEASWLNVAIANFRKFKLPQLLPRSTETINIPQFDFNELVVKERIGQGSFGDVFTAMSKAPGSEETKTGLV